MALEIFRLVGSVFVDTDKAEKSLKKTDKNAEGLGKRFVSMVGTAAKFGAAVIGAATAAGGAMVALAENTREYREEQGKLQSAFESGGFAAKDARKSYEALNGILGDSGQAVEAASHLAELCDNTEQLSKWGTICTGVNAKWGKSLPVENLTEAANMAAKTCEVSSGLADALDWAGVSSEKFKEKLEKCNSEQDRQALITETLMGLYSDEAAAYEAVNANVIAANIAQDKLNNTMAKIGGIVEPIITQGKLLIASVLEKATPAIETLSGVVIPFLVQWISKLFDWFALLTDRLTASGITFESVMNVLQSTFTVAMTVLQGIWNTIGKPVWDFMMLAVSLVAEAFAEYMPQIQQFVKATFGDIIQLWQGHLLPALRAIGDFIQNVLAPVFEFVFKNVIAPVVGSVFQSIGQLWTNSLKPILQGIIDFVSGVFSLNFQKAFRGLVQALGGIWDGLKTIVKAPLNAVISIINKFIQGLNKIKVPDWIPGLGGKGINIKTLPYLYDGGVLKRGQVGVLEGSGAEAVVPLHNNKKWISAVAQDMQSAGIGGNSDAAQLLLEAFLAFVAALPAMLSDALDDKKLAINQREFARLVKAVK